MAGTYGGLEQEMKCTILMGDDLSLQGCVKAVWPWSPECDFIHSMDTSSSH